MSGDIFGCDSLGGSVLLSPSGVKPSNAAKHPIVHGQHPQMHPSNGTSAVKKLCSKLGAPCDLNGKEIPKRGDICICIADSLCCTVETNTK